MLKKIILIIIAIIGFICADIKLEENRTNVTKGFSDFVCIIMQFMSIVLILIEIFK